MASRDIANMHLFLDLKKKFPDLPDETLRNYISLFAEDQEKCISLLQKESENHYHPSQPFSDFRLPESKLNSKRNDYVKHFSGNVSESAFPSVALQQTETAFSKKVPSTSGRSSSHAGVVHLPGKMLSAPSKPESRSAPVITSSERPFNMYKQSSESSHSTLCQVPSDRNNQMMFSTTKEHIIEPPLSHESIAYLPISGEPEHSRKHAVKLSITPSFPFQQQHLNIFNNSVCATASHLSRPGRHTTSLNFQLQPQSSNQFPLEISTIPTNIGNPCNSRDFGSHVQISVGSQGATFTALRLQRPNYSQTQSISPLPAAEECPEEDASSHAKNSNLYLFPDRRIEPPSSHGMNEAFKYPEVQGFDQSQHKFASKNSNASISSIPSYQSPNYILAVKNHQIAQLDLILSELEKEKSICSQLKAEVNRMEQEMTQKTAAKSSFPYAEELHKLREEIRSLRVECSCLSMEVDSAGQIPLGVTDEDFYSNIFTGPNGAITSPSLQGIPTKPDAKKLKDEAKNKQPSFEDDDDDENNRWKCKKCTFANHPALEKCEMCELPKNSEYVEYNSCYSPSTSLRFVSSPKDQPRRAVGSVQISVTRRVPSSSKSVKLQLTHRLPR